MISQVQGPYTRMNSNVQSKYTECVKYYQVKMHPSVQAVVTSLYRWGQVQVMNTPDRPKSDHLAKCPGQKKTSIQGTSYSRWQPRLAVGVCQHLVQPGEGKEPGLDPG